MPAGSRSWAAVAFVGAAAVAGVAFWALRDRAPMAVPPGPVPIPAAAVAAKHAGSAQCAACHAKEHAAWKGSDHDLAMQLADEKSVLGDFANARFSYAGTTSTFSRRDGKFFVNTDGPDGKLADYEIKYAFGVRPLQQYLIELARLGRLLTPVTIDIVARELNDADALVRLAAVDALAKALAEYVAVQTYNADRPEGRTSLGNLYAQRADAAAAIGE